MFKKRKISSGSISTDFTPTKGVKHTKVKLSKGSAVKLSILGVLILVIVFILVSLFSSGTSFITESKSFLKSTKGYFSYTIDVQSIPKTTTTDEIDGDTSPDISAEASSDSVELNTEWRTTTNSDSLWDYPRYQLIVSGNITSVEPLTSSFTVAIKTELYESDITSVTILDGDYYFNIGMLKKWLYTTGMTNLSSIADTIPDGVAYLLVPESDFNWYSPFSETSERASSGFPTFSSAKSSGDTLLTLLIDIMNKSIGSNKGVLSSSSDTYTLNVSPKDSSVFLKSLGTSINRNTYKAYANSIVPYIGEERGKQVMREVDNFLSYSDPLKLKLTSASDSDLQSYNLVMSGSYRESETADKMLNFATSWDLDDKTCVLNIQALKKPSTTQVEVPVATTCNISQLESSGCDLGTLYLSIIDYLDCFNIYKEVTLVPTSSSIVNDFLDSLVSYLNTQMGYSLRSEKVTRDTLRDFLEANKDYVVVDEIYKELDKFNEDMRIETVVYKEEKLEQFLRFDIVRGEQRFIASVNEEDSNNKILCVNMLIMNNSQEDISVDLTNFQLHDLEANLNPANYADLILDVNPQFNMEEAPQTAEILAGGSADVKLYFTIPQGFKYYDVWFDGKVLGDIVAY